MATITTTQYGPITIAMSDGIVYPLTACCNASAKGMDYPTGTGCRACYREIDSIFGMGAAIADRAGIMDMLMVLKDAQPAAVRKAMDPAAAVAALGA